MEIEPNGRSGNESETSDEEMIGFEAADLVRRSASDDDSSSGEEFYTFYDSDGADSATNLLDMDDSDSDSDFEEQNGGFDSTRAWGRNNLRFYNSDYVDGDFGGFYHSSDIEAAIREGEEARRIQNRLNRELNETDFVIALRASERQTTGNERFEEVARDLSSLSTRQKLDLMQKESPEFFVLVQDLKSKLNEIDNVLIPILNYFGNKQDMPAPVKFLKKKFLVLTNYCTNITFYLLLKAKRSPVENHPVLKSLYKYRRVMEEIQELDEAMRPKIEKVLMELKDCKNPALEKLANSLRKKHQQNGTNKSKEEQDSAAAGTSAEPTPGTSAEPTPGTSAEPTPGTSAEPTPGTSAEPTPGTSRSFNARKVLQLQKATENYGRRDKGKRAITYQMAKNKGLIPKRNKLQRNPRVKHRKKYRKALIKRRGQVRYARTEIPVYGGEPSGIKATITKSVKLK